MTAPTHRAVAIGWLLIGCMILYKTSMTEINYYLSMIIMLRVGRYGAEFPDIDHSWQNVKEKTVPNLIINKLIHVTGGKHRSWQTHSLDIVLVVSILSYIIPWGLYSRGLISLVNKEVLSLILIAFSLGWISHLFSDMLTSAGVRITCLSKVKMALVPKQLFGLRFNTGHEWEEFVYKLTKKLNLLIGLLAVFFPLIINYI